METEKQQLTNDQYRAIEALSATDAKVAYKNPREYEAQCISFTRPRPDFSTKRQVVTGTVVHEVLLEKRHVTELVTHYPADCLNKAGGLIAKRANEFRELMASQGIIAVKDDQFKQIVSVCNAVMDHDLGQLIGRDDIVFEQPIFWTDSASGIDCKARPDFVYEDEDAVLCYDLKVTESVHPSQWMRLANNLMYWLQDAHYSSGLAHITGKPVRFVFWVVESCWPHRIARYEYDPISRERSGEAYARFMADLSRRLDENDWSESWESEINMLQLNPWDVNADEEGELEGFDDDGDA